MFSLKGRAYIEDQIALVWIEDEIVSQCVDRRSTRENDGVLGIFAPLREQLSGETTLQIRRACQDQLVLAWRVQAVQLVDGSTEFNVLEIERIVTTHFERLDYFVVHPFDL